MLHLLSKGGHQFHCARSWRKQWFLRQLAFLHQSGRTGSLSRFKKKHGLGLTLFPVQSGIPDEEETLGIRAPIHGILMPIWNLFRESSPIFLAFRITLQ